MDCGLRSWSSSAELDPLELEVPYLVTQPLTTKLESRRRSFRRPPYEAAIGSDVAQPWLCRESSQHLCGIRLPVGREAQRASILQPVSHEGDERGLHQSALVVPLL